MQALAEQLREGVDALGLNLNAAQQGQLLEFLALLAKWSKVYNLTAVREPNSMLRLHLLDSLAALAPLRRHTGGQPTRVLDVGSGGGLPGVAFAVAAPELQVSCVDTVEKKVRFLTQVAAELGLPNLRAVHSRVEQMQAEAFPLITCRAFAALPDFVSWTRPLLAPGGVWLALKGQHPAEEIAALPADVEVFHVEQLEVPGVDAQRCLIWLRPKA